MQDPPFPRGSTVFVDESKSNAYVLVATAVAPGSVVRARKEMRSLTRSGQRRIHFTRESRSSRGPLADRIAGVDAVSVAYVVRGADDHTSRETCLRKLVQDVVDSCTVRLVLERDSSLERADRRIIRDRLVELDSVAAVEYRHEDAHLEPMLWTSDAVAWCVQTGGDWPARVRPLLASVEVIEAGKSASLARRTVRKTARPTSRH